MTVICMVPTKGAGIDRQGTIHLIGSDMQGTNNPCDSPRQGTNNPCGISSRLDNVSTSYCCPWVVQSPDKSCQVALTPSPRVHKVRNSSEFHNTWISVILPKVVGHTEMSGHWTLCISYTVLVKGFAPLNRIFFLASLEEIGKLRKWAPLSQGGHRKFIALNVRNLWPALYSVPKKKVNGP